MEYSEFWVDNSRCQTKPCSHNKPAFNCPQLPGTILRVSIPPGAVINLLNLVELTSPGGVCVIIRLPFLGRGGGTQMSGFLDAVRAAGGTVEVVDQ